MSRRRTNDGQDHTCDWLFLKRLETALETERKKYAKTPITTDRSPGHEVAQAWGYVVAGYFLMEQGFKSIRYARGEKPEKIHTQYVLFDKLQKEDQNILCGYYEDFRRSFPGMSSLPFPTLNKFLENLDDNGKGGLDWRYFLIPDRGNSSSPGPSIRIDVKSGLPVRKGDFLSPKPSVGIEVMHELVHGCVCLVETIIKDEEPKSALRHTYSWWCQRKRWKRQRDWLTVRRNSPEWGKEGDRLEILSGPACDDRYDYLVFEGERSRRFSALLPDAEKVGLPILDERDELESFDPVKGFQSIGVILP